MCEVESCHPGLTLLLAAGHASSIMAFLHCHNVLTLKEQPSFDPTAQEIFSETARLQRAGQNVSCKSGARVTFRAINPSKEDLLPLSIQRETRSPLPRQPGGSGSRYCPSALGTGTLRGSQGVTPPSLGLLFSCCTNTSNPDKGNLLSGALPVPRLHLREDANLERSGRI